LISNFLERLENSAGFIVALRIPTRLEVLIPEKLSCAIATNPTNKLMVINNVFIVGIFM
jgi:hypothetical protein